jgi:heat shock protein HslJ
LLAATLPFVVGCGGAEGAAAPDLEVVTRVEQGDSLPALARSAAYVGVIPCDGCSDDPSLLVLHPDGTYRVRTPGATRDSTRAAVVIGRWTVGADPVPFLALHGRTAATFFEIASPLRLRVAGVAADLVRVSASGALSGLAVVRGEFRDEAGGASLVTCDGGIRFPVHGTESLAALRRLHAGHPLGDGAATRVEAVGRLDVRPAGTDAAAGSHEVFVLDSFAPLPARAPCEAMRVRATIAVGDLVLAALDGEPLPAATSAIPTLRFVLSEPTMFGSTGCNRFTGRARLRGLDLEPQPLAVTRRACADSTVMAREVRFSQVLSDGGWFRLDGSELVLSRGGTEVARFRRR